MDESDDNINITELSDLVNRDSEGHLLAQYLQKKAGAALGNRIFGDIKEKRLTVDVCIKKIQKLTDHNKDENQNVDGRQGSDEENENSSSSDELQQMPMSDENQNGYIITERSRTPSPLDELESSLQAIFHEPIDTNGKSKQNLQERTTCTSTQKLPERSIPKSIQKLKECPSPKSILRSPLSGKVNRNCSPSDRLRRISLASRSKYQRTLLNEFENAENSAVSNFSPPVASTPRSSQSKIIEKRNAENIEAFCNVRGDATYSQPPEAQRSSHFSRQYSIQKGSIPGQAILTPTKMINNNNSKTIIEHNKTESMPNVIIKSSRNATVVNVEGAAHATRENINSARSPQSPVLVIPIHQTFTRSHSKNTKELSVSAANVAEKQSVKVQGDNKDNDGSEEQEEEEELNISNIITDDESEKEVPTSRRNVNASKRNSNIPIDLAATNIVNSTRTRQKRRKYSSSQRHLQIEHATETDSDLDRPTDDNVMTRAVPTRSTRSKSRCGLPLNKVPNIPINGEMFAAELKRQTAGFSNREILDLRKRRSKKLSLERFKKTNNNKKRSRGANNEFQNCEEILTNSEAPNPDEIPTNYCTTTTNTEVTNHNEIVCENLDGNELVDKNCTNPNATIQNNEASQRDELDCRADILKRTYLNVTETLIGEDNNIVLPVVSNSRNSKTNIPQKKKRSSRPTPEHVRTYIEAVSNISRRSNREIGSKRSLYFEKDPPNESCMTASESILTDIPIIAPPPMFQSEIPSSYVVPPKESTTNEKNTSDGVFKKPKGRPPKKKTAKAPVQNNASTQQLESLNDTSVRRSQRSRKEVQKSLFCILFEKQILGTKTKSEHSVNRANGYRNNNRGRASQSVGTKTTFSENETLPIASSTANSYTKPKAPPKTNSRKKIKNKLKPQVEECFLAPQLPTINENIETNECNDDEALAENIPPPKTQKHVRVRLKRMKEIDSINEVRAEQNVAYNMENHENITENMEFVQAAVGHESDFISLLKNKLAEDDTCSHTSSKMSRDSNFSSFGELACVNFSGLDYLFYDTEDTNSVGYIRFQPNQLKPASSLKVYQMKFLIMSGKFSVFMNDSTINLNEGDLFVVPKGSRYSMQNDTDRVGLVLFMRK